MNLEMVRVRTLVAALTACMMLAVASAAAAATPSLQRVGRAPALPLGSALLGVLPDATTMHVTVAIKPRDPAGLAQLAQSVATVGSPGFRHFLTPAAFARRFGASAATLTAVENSLRASGLTPGAVSANRLSIAVTATAGALSRAFDVVLSRIREPGGLTAVVNSLPPAVATAIAPAVQAVVGLDDLGAVRPLDVRPTRTAAHATARVAPHVATGGPQPCAAASGAAPGQDAYTADEIASAYDFSGLYTAGDLGQGTTIGIYELEPDDNNDIAAFQSCYGTSAPVSYVPVDGGAGSGAGSGEAALDIEQVVGLAPKANVIVYQGPNSNSNGPGAGPYDVFATMINDDRAQVITTSWGQCEALEGSADAHAEETLFEQAAAQGQTIVSAAGDDGSEDCDVPGGIPNTTLAVDDPGSDPFVTSVGGTSLTQLGPPPVESVWNNGGGLTGLLGAAPGAGGGGVSSIWPMPSYQAGAAAALGVIGDGSSTSACGAAEGYCREVPDVAADADPDFGYLIYYNGAGSERDAPVGWQGTGGTSGAAPVWGALVALADASKGCAGAPVGFANPALYRAADSDYAATFRDITTGNNDYTGSHGGLYPAKSGYDMATGLGSPDAAPLASELCSDSLRVTNPGPLSSSVRAIVRYQLQAHDAAGSALGYGATGLPTGLRLNSTTGVVTGTPRRAGNYTVRLTVSDSDTDVQAASFTWVIAAAPALSNVSLRAVGVRRPVLALKLAAARGGPAFTQVAVTLPAGLRLAGRPRALTLTGVGGKRLRYSAAVRGATLTLTLPVASTQASLTLRYAAISTTNAFSSAVRRGRRSKLTLRVRATDPSGVSVLSTVLRPRS
jgi:subtilase family serine protease